MNKKYIKLLLPNGKEKKLEIREEVEYKITPELIFLALSRKFGVDNCPKFKLID